MPRKRRHHQNAIPVRRLSFTSKRLGAVDTPATYRQTRRIVRDIGLALTGRAALSFLQRNGLAPGDDGPEEQPADLLEHTRGFVAWVERWE